MREGKEDPGKIDMRELESNQMRGLTVKLCWLSVSERSTVLSWSFLSALGAQRSHISLPCLLSVLSLLIPPQLFLSPPLRHTLLGHA